MNTCQWIVTRGENRGKRCCRQTVEGSDYCAGCRLKKGIQADRGGYRIGEMEQHAAKETPLTIPTIRQEMKTALRTTDIGAMHHHMIKANEDIILTNNDGPRAMITPFDLPQTPVELPKIAPLEGTTQENNPENIPIPVVRIPIQFQCKY